MFAADNINHNIISLEGKRTFHGDGSCCYTRKEGQCKTTIVFDGYIEESNTKDITLHRRRQNRASHKVSIAEGTKFVRKKEDFLSNEENSFLAILFYNA